MNWVPIDSCLRSRGKRYHCAVPPTLAPTRRQILAATGVAAAAAPGVRPRLVRTRPRRDA